MTAFVIGYLQGAIRRLLGIASILFALVFAAQIRGPFGDFLVGNWTQYPPEYTRMLAFGIVFMVLAVAFTIMIENFYERSPILPRFRLADPIIGGILGVFQAGIIVGAVILILDSYFKGVGLAFWPTEFLLLRDFNHAVDVSQTAKFYRHDFIPVFFFFLGALIPEEIRRLYPR